MTWGDGTVNNSLILDQPRLCSLSALSVSCMGFWEEAHSSLPYSVRVPVRKTVTEMLPHAVSIATLGHVSQDRPGWLISGLNKRVRRTYMENISSGVSDRY